MAPLAADRADQATAPARARASNPACPVSTLRRDAVLTSMVAGILALPLDAFAEAGQLLHIRVPWDTDLIWFVPTPEEAKILMTDGVNPGRIWTAATLRALLAATLTREGVRRIAQTRIAFEAEEVVIGPPRPTAEPDPEQLTLEAL